MQKYLVRIPRFIHKMYSNYCWRINTKNKELYLTFDDGPTPEVTTFVLDTLEKYNAKATFFCIGKNVRENLVILKRILNDGHQVGNHTNHHLNGWKTNTKDYIKDILNAQIELNKHIDASNSNKLFRPAYGRVTKKQAKKLRKNDFKIVMWTVLSGDFDINLSIDKCYQNCVSNIENGDIIVLHDSVKSFKKLKVILPKILQFYTENGFELKSLNFSK